MNDAADLWLAVLNEAMLGKMRGEPYLAALADEAREWFQLPSRTDFDDLASSVTELRREVRALKAAPRRHRSRRMARMQRSGPGARCVEFEGCGHAPSLMRPDQFDTVTTFLEAA